MSQPQPKIPPELIKFLGKSFAAWHIAIPLLESHVIIFPDESRCFDALAELYKQVSGNNTCIDKGYIYYDNRVCGGPWGLFACWCWVGQICRDWGWVRSRHIPC